MGLVSGCLVDGFAALGFAKVKVELVGDYAFEFAYFTKDDLLAFLIGDFGLWRVFSVEFHIRSTGKNEDLDVNVTLLGGSRGDRVFPSEVFPCFCCQCFAYGDGNIIIF